QVCHRLTVDLRENVTGRNTRGSRGAAGNDLVNGYAAGTANHGQACAVKLKWRREGIVRSKVERPVRRIQGYGKPAQNLAADVAGQIGIAENATFSVNDDRDGVRETQ